MNPAPRLFAGIGIISLLVAGILSYVFFAPLSSGTNSIRYAVHEGDSINHVAKELADTGAITNDMLFRFVWRLEGGGKMQAGTYTIPPQANMHDLYRILRSDPDRQEMSIRIIEGWTTQQISDYFEERKLTNASDFLRSTQQDWKSQYPFLSDIPPRNGLEGYLFPDTYRIFEDSDSEVIIRKMIDNFGKKITSDMREDARKQGYTLHAIVTLASIIEREVKGEQERRIVSDIFRRRLSIGMPLQADSTINYLTGKKDPQAASADLRIDSLYNTYKYKGLPPGPIGNPGLESLNAALHPISNTYLYFLTSPDGKAHFSETFEEHKQKKYKFL